MEINEMLITQQIMAHEVMHLLVLPPDGTCHPGDVTSSMEGKAGIMLADGNPYGSYERIFIPFYG